MGCSLILNYPSVSVKKNCFWQFYVFLSSWQDLSSDYLEIKVIGIKFLVHCQSAVFILNLVDNVQ